MENSPQNIRGYIRIYFTVRCDVLVVCAKVVGATSSDVLLVLVYMSRRSRDTFNRHSVSAATKFCAPMIVASYTLGPVDSYDT